MAASAGIAVCSRTTLLPPARPASNLVVFAVWTCFTTATLLVVSHHEPWFDEAQAWLIARDNSPFEILFRRMHYEGTPGLWHLMLWGLIKLGFPYQAMGYLSLLLASISVAIFLKSASFPLWLRTLFVFGYFPAYQYSVVARSYVLNLLFISIVATLFARRLSRPWSYCITLALLANAYGFMVAVAIFLEFIWSIRRARMKPRSFLAPVILFVVFCVFAAVQAMPAADTSFARQPFSFRRAVWAAAAQIVLGFVQWHGASRILEFAISAAVLIAALPLARKARHAPLFCAVCGFPYAFGVFKHFAAHHAGILYLSWIFVLWISWSALPKLTPNTRRAVLAAVTFVFVFHAYDALAAWRLDFFTSYSASRQAGGALHAYLKPGASGKLACVGYKALAIQPYFDHNLCANYAGGRPKPSYYLWIKNEPYKAWPDIRYLEDLIHSGTYELILVSDASISRPDAELLGRENGYCPVEWFPGRLIWKNRQDDGGTDDLGLFRRCGRQTVMTPR